MATRRELKLIRHAHVLPDPFLVAHEMPPHEVLASMQHVEQRALDLRAAGMPGTLFAFLSGTDWRPGRRHSPGRR